MAVRIEPIGKGFQVFGTEHFLGEEDIKYSKELGGFEASVVLRKGKSIDDPRFLEPLARTVEEASFVASKGGADFYLIGVRVSPAWKECFFGIAQTRHYVCEYSAKLFEKAEI